MPLDVSLSQTDYYLSYCKPFAEYGTWVLGSREARELHICSGTAVATPFLTWAEGCCSSSVLKLLLGARGVRHTFLQDGRLSILRLEQLLKEKIATNTTFKVKTATGSVAGAGRRGHAASDTRQADDDVEVSIA